MSTPTLQATLDAISHAILIFDGEDKLLQHNITAGALLGADLNLIRSGGWVAAAELLDAGILDPEERLEAVRKRALSSERPVRAHMLRNGEYIPYSIAVAPSPSGRMSTLLTIDSPDWNIVGDVLERFRKEMNEAIESTVGHIALINRTLHGKDDDPATTKLARRLGGFTRLIAIHMERAARLMTLMSRLESIRAGRLPAHMLGERRRIALDDFLEDFGETLDDGKLIDPESEAHDYRARVKLSLNTGLAVNAAPRYLTLALQELLRNAIMYSLRGTPISIMCSSKGAYVQIDVTDEGYGIREADWERIFQPYERARQPQILSEFGYGLALHLVKQEVEAMNGRIWFKSTVAVGTTFSIQLPAWNESHAATAP